ncbi:MAG: HAMP domain-containing sensor histidine kinase [Coleofasciculaceae cyanobacterium]
MDLIYLVIGLGLGLLGSRLLSQRKETENPQHSESQTVPVETEIEPLKQELEQTQLAYAMAEHMGQFKAGFFARTAHELRSPLSSLIGMHQLILSDLCDSPEEEKEFIAQANISAQKMVKLLEEVVTVAKTEHGTESSQISPVQLKRMFTELECLTHLQAANRNLRLEVVAPDPSWHVTADPRRFQQVLLGLVDSAIAQMEEGNIKVEADTQQQEGFVCIRIDLESPNSLWSELVGNLPIDAISEERDHQTAVLSEESKLLIFKTLLEVMQGELKVEADSLVEVDASSETAKRTRLECFMPLATPETVESGLAGG